MPDELIARIARVEQRMSGLEQDVRSLEPLIADAATLRADMRHVEQGVDAMRSEVHGLRVLIEQRDKDAAQERQQRDAQVSAERRATKTALWTLVGVIGAAVITAIGAVVAAGV